jgi:cytochrome c biogenesis protein CcdA/thiol-disulfide isomerase/thioredoxin
MALLLVFAFIAGAGTAASPCVLPVLPAVLSASATGGRRRPLGIVLGLTATFTATVAGIGALAGGAGLGGDGLRTVAAVVLLAFGVALIVPRLGALAEAPFARLARFGPRSTGHGFVSGLAVGGALGFAYAPCAGPILAAVITVGAASGRVLAVALAYAAGSAVVLLALALGGRRVAERIRRAGRGPALQRALGVVMVATAVAVAANLDVRVQTALATHFPAIVVDPAGSLERSHAAQSGLAQLRAAPRFATHHGATPSQLPVLGTAPAFTGTQRWFNTPGGRPLTLAALRGRVVLVDFWTYTCINCLRTLPYVRGWADRYRSDGLVVVGVHTPEFGFEHDAGNVERAIRANHLHYPVVQDNAYATWNAWGNDAWPADYLIDARGRVREAHAGEGDYSQTEAAIRSLLREAGRDRLGADADVRGGETATPDTTPETYVGADRAQGWTVPPRSASTMYPGVTSPLRPGAFALGGSWRVSGESARAAAPGAHIDANVRAKSVYLVLSGPGHVQVALDGRPIPAREAGADVHGGAVDVRGQRLYRLVSLPRAGDHRISLRFDEGVSAFAFTFG